MEFGFKRSASHCTTKFERHFLQDSVCVCFHTRALCVS